MFAHFWKFPNLGQGKTFLAHRVICYRLLPLFREKLKKSISQNGKFFESDVKDFFSIFFSSKENLSPEESFIRLEEEEEAKEVKEEEEGEEESREKGIEPELVNNVLRFVYSNRFRAKNATMTAAEKELRFPEMLTPPEGG